MATPFKCPCGGQNRVFSNLKHLVFSNLETFVGDVDLSICNCGLITKLLSPSYFRQISEHYLNYLNPRSDSSGKPNFPALQFGSKHREIAKFISNLMDSKNYKTLLDYGCGDGSLLSRLASFSSGNLSLFGFDEYTTPSFRYEDNIDFLSKDELCSDFNYDLISLVHTIEHLNNPIEVLKLVRGKLNSNGLLFVQCPIWKKNYFDFAVADHLFHFDEESIHTIMDACDFQIISISYPVSKKEMSIIAKPLNTESTHRNIYGIRDTKITLASEFSRIYESWTKLLIDFHLKHPSFKIAIYGLGIAGSLLYDICQSLELEVVGFVDDEKARYSFEFRGVDIFSPLKLVEFSQNVIVLVPFDSNLSKEKANELSQNHIKCIYFDQENMNFVIT